MQISVSKSDPREGDMELIKAISYMIENMEEWAKDSREMAENADDKETHFFYSGESEAYGFAIRRFKSVRGTIAKARGVEL